MMRYLSLAEILFLHKELISTSGGSGGVRDLGALESAINQPRITFDQKELCPDLVSKAAALCFSIIKNHPFIDGNKRVGHAAMEVFLFFNGHEIKAGVDEQENLILDIASGKLDRKNFTSWIKDHITIASS